MESIKYVTNNGKVSMVKGEIISRCGGVLALITPPGEKQISSVTHILTGASLKRFTRKAEAMQFARSFYLQLSKREKRELRKCSDFTILSSCFTEKIRLFVRTWKCKK